jgi:hypothetical protein
MYRTNRLEQLLLRWPGAHKGIHVHWPHRARARRRGLLFERAERTGRRDFMALLALLLLVGGLVLTAAWMSREVGRAMAIAAVCDGDCPPAATSTSR